MVSTTQIIRDILIEGKAHTQDEIRQELARRSIQVSQPNVSRLLHKIGAVKLIDDKGKTHYRLPHEAGLLHELTSTQEKDILRQWLLDIVSNDHLIIIYTTPGAASMVARIVDQHRTQLSILGTIAGDDTIFVAPTRSSAIPETLKLIRVLFKL
jgi:transcriptional regulator of arginine metabolism